jgi:hypothetical protein
MESSIPQLSAVLPPARTTCHCAFIISDAQTPVQKVIHFLKTDPQALAALQTERQIDKSKLLSLFWLFGGTSSTSSTWTAGVLLQTERHTTKSV